MYKQTPKFRKQLNQNQLEILRILFRYRFASRDLIAQYFNKKDVYRQLLVLEDRGLIGRRYEPSYKLAGKPAAYYLKPDGLRELQQVSGDMEANVKSLYRATQVSEQFINHCMSILSISLHLRRQEPKTKFFTKINLRKNDYSYFPSPLPDAYIRVKDSHYFLNYIDNSKPFFAIVRWLKLLEEYYENGTWDDTGTDFPIVLFVTDSMNTQKRLHKFIVKNVEGIKIYTALRRDVINDDGKIWRNAEESDEFYSLTELGSLRLRSKDTRKSSLAQTTPLAD